MRAPGACALAPYQAIQVEMNDQLVELGDVKLPQAESKFRSAIRWQSRFVNFLAILAVPAAIGIWLSVVDPGTETGLFWSVLLPLIVLQVILYVVTTLYAETVPELNLRNKELTEVQELMAGEIEDADYDIEWLLAANTLGSYWSTFQGLITYLNPVDDERFSEACRIAVSPMIESAGVLFDFDFGEVWSATVYRYNENDNMLEAVWWDRPADHPAQGTPRSWRPGDGHVGSAFMQDRILFTTDMTSDDAAMLLKPSVSNERSYDADVYRSFVSAPILLDAKPDPFRFGVLVITSNEVGRFDEDNKTIVAHAAQVLAHLFYWRKLADQQIKH
jgi:hypothetical protein